MTVSTDYSKKISTLSEFWYINRESEKYQNFIEYNSVGLPLAFMLDNDMCKDITEKGLVMIEESYRQLSELRVENPSEELEKFFA